MMIPNATNIIVLKKNTAIQSLGLIAQGCLANQIPGNVSQAKMKRASPLANMDTSIDVDHVAAF